MDNFGSVRRLAREKHAAMRTSCSGATATELLAAARRDTGIAIRAVGPDHPLLGGGDGALHRKGEKPSIYISSALTPEVAAYVEAHEFGHFWIETPEEPAVTPRTSDPGAPEENTPVGLRRVEAYSPQELRERYANVFAREFLLPGPEAVRRFSDEAPASRIAKDLGLPLGLVNQQLAVALLLPDPVAVEKETVPRERPGLDDSQRNAAEHEGSPLLVEAGPGTGKTRTLVARVEHLLAKGVPPPSILALTFSNKAAREDPREGRRKRAGRGSGDSGRALSTRSGSNCSASAATSKELPSRLGSSIRRISSRFSNVNCRNSASTITSAFTSRCSSSATSSAPSRAQRTRCSHRNRTPKRPNACAGRPGRTRRSNCAPTRPPRLRGSTPTTTLVSAPTASSTLPI